MMLILRHEHGLPSAIRRERNRSNAQTGESALESVPAGEGAGVAPCFPDVLTSIRLRRVGGGGERGQTLGPKDLVGWAFLREFVG